MSTRGETPTARSTVHWLRMATGMVAVAMSIYHVYTAGSVTPSFFVHYPVHLCFVLVILFSGDLLTHWETLRGGRRLLILAWDALLIVVSIASTAYLFTGSDYVDSRMVWFEELTTVELVLATGLVMALVVAARRTVGLVLAVVLLVFIAYVFVGPHLPEPFWHRGQGIDRILELFYLTPDGIFNVPVKVTADYIFLFVLLGALLIASGAGTFFTDLAYSLTGRAVGGPAKTAVVSSAFMGMLQGSSAGNVVTTGPFTIPAMRRAGYPGPFAAGVEAVASSGGQLTPPIMGGAAFIMSELAGVPYGEIIQVALIPALLYFFAVFIMVDLEARRLKLTRAVPADLPALSTVILKRGYLLGAIVVLVGFLLQGYTPTKAGFWALVSLVVLIIVFDGATRRRLLPVLWEAMSTAPRMVAPVTVACAIGGMIAGIIVMTGLGLRLSSMILAFADGQLLVALILTMLTCVVLGMGMPTSAAYIILAALLAGGLVKLGVPLIAAHFFIIYCAAKSSITPPVAVASYAAAAVADTNPWQTSLVAFRLGISVFIIPYMFVYGPPLLGVGSALAIAWATLTASFGIFALSVATAGWLIINLRFYERLGALLAALPMIYVDWRSDMVGLLIFLAVLGSILWRRSRTIVSA